MIQRNVRLIKETGIANEIIIVTGDDQKELIEKQVGEGVTIVTEPARRDTFPAIYLACAYLYSRSVSPDETILVLPCDTYACEGYYNFLKEITEAVDDRAADMVLMGICPTHASPKFGYIVPDNTKPNQYIQTIADFAEKPDIRTANRLIDEGALWNSGVCGFKLGYLMSLGVHSFKTTDYHTLVRDYAQLPKMNFSYDVLEKNERSVVLTFCGDWKDIGTWNTLATELSKKEHGFVISADCKDSLIINELNKPLLCIGGDELVIIATYDGILVAERGKSEYIKPLVDSLSAEPMVEERRWGQSEIIETLKTINDTRVEIIHLSVNPDTTMPCKSNSRSEEILIVIDGTGQIYFDGVISNLEKDSVLHIPKSTSYSVRAETSLNMLLIRRIACDKGNIRFTNLPPKKRNYGK